MSENHDKKTNENNKKISCIMKANDKSCITKCFESIISNYEKATEIQFILITKTINNNIDKNENITDSILDNIRKYKDDYDVKIYFTSSERSDIRLRDIITGEYVIFIDDSVIFLDGCLHSLIETMNENIHIDGCIPITNETIVVNSSDLSSFSHRMKLLQKSGYINGYVKADNYAHVSCMIFRKNDERIMNDIDTFIDQKFYLKYLNSNPSISNPSISNPSISNPSISNTNSSTPNFVVSYCAMAYVAHKEKKYIVDASLVDPKIIQKYVSSNSIERYLYLNQNLNSKRINLLLSSIVNKPNGIKFDIEFYKYVNNLQQFDDDYALKHIYNHGIMYGLIYHPQQLSNALALANGSKKEIDVYRINDGLYIKSDNNSKTNDDNFFIDLRIFVEMNIYNKTYDDFISSIKVMETKIYSDDKINLLLCVFIGDLNVGYDLLNKILTYDKKEKFYIGITFRSIQLYKKLSHIIKNKMNNYVLFVNNEYGNDITPTLQVYNYFITKKNNKIDYKFDYVIKLHTKTLKAHFEACVDYVLSKSLNELCSLLNTSKCNCVGHPNFYFESKNDIHNADYKNIYAKSIDNNKYFVATTNFFTTTTNMNKILEFIRNNNPSSYFLNNMYDTNHVNRTNSPVHFLERLFGMIT
jgi:hypothetical protein